MLRFDVEAFADELEKIALAAPGLGELARKAIGTVSGRALLGAAAGTAGGAALDSENRARGAIRGGLGGLGLGFGSSLFSGSGRAVMGGALKRFGQRQWHGFTGRGSMPVAPGTTPEALLKQKSLEEAGLTSIPGLVKNLATRPIKTVGEAWRQSDKLGKGLTVLPAGQALLSKNEDGESRTSKVLKGVGSGGLMMLASRMPIIPSLALGLGVPAAATAIGKGINRLRGKPQEEGLNIDTGPASYMLAQKGLESLHQSSGGQ